MLKAALQLFVDSVCRRGLILTTRHAASRIAYFLRDSTPERRRARFGDLDFDLENSVDTTSARQSLLTRLRGLFTASEYQATDPETFRDMMAALPLCFESFTFLELGSGKGRAVLLASEYPFARIVGVELLPELHSIARQNLDRFPRSRQRCSAVELLCGDARDFPFPAEPSVVYLFNPFPEMVLQDVIAGLKASLDESPRPLLIVYYNPLLKHLFERQPWLQPVRITDRWIIYRNQR